MDATSSQDPSRPSSSMPQQLKCKAQHRVCEAPSRPVGPGPLPAARHLPPPRPLSPHCIPGQGPASPPPSKRTSFGGGGPQPPSLLSSFLLLYSQVTSDLRPPPRLPLTSALPHTGPGDILPAALLTPVLPFLAHATVIRDGRAPPTGRWVPGEQPRRLSEASLAQGLPPSQEDRVSLEGDRGLWEQAGHAFRLLTALRDVCGCVCVHRWVGGCVRMRVCVGV